MRKTGEAKGSHGDARPSGEIARALRELSRGYTLQSCLRRRSSGDKPERRVGRAVFDHGGALDCKPTNSFAQLGRNFL